MSRSGSRQIQGTIVSMAGNKVITYGVGRECEFLGCKTILSRYNRGGACSVHEEAVRVQPHKWFSK